MTKLLITGGGGQLGQAFAAYQRTAAQRHAIEMMVLTRAELDITSAASIQAVLQHSQARLVINAAAYTDVARAELEPDKAYAVNVEGAALLAAHCAAAGVDLIQLSTDYVFDGTKGAPYEVTDQVNPLNVYGHSKVAAEKAVMQEHPQAIIVRTAWLYSEFGHNFQTKLLSAANSGLRLRVVDDEWGTPTKASDLVRFLMRLSENLVPYRGQRMHFAGEQVMSRWELAQQIVVEAFERGELAMLPQIEAVKTSTQAKVVKRPLNSALKSSLLSRDGA